MKIRRIVTGHDSSGKAIVKTDEQITAVSRIAAGISGCEIWSTDRMPIDNSAAADPVQRAGFVKQYNYVGDGGGRRSGSTNSLLAMRDSRTAPKPWTTGSCCQGRLTANSKMARSSI